MLKTVIGLEIHVELKTCSKLFCSCENVFGKEPNSSVCPVCLGMPGTLPVTNKEAVKQLLKSAIALECEISKHSKFDRKNYFYPDMPKNYQISQYDMPFAKQGTILLETPDGERIVRITRIHLEEDTGKSIHTGAIEESEFTLLDYNRAGVPLMEIVTEPDITSPKEAYEFLVKLKHILSWIEVSDCKMEEGSLRCDVNVSMRDEEKNIIGNKVEIKNLNSFKAVSRALEFEIKRQSLILEKGERVIQETRGWNEDKNATVSMRSKEEAHDYRYFPEPDIPDFEISDSYINDIKMELPELPFEREKRFINKYNLSELDSHAITLSRDIADFFEETLNFCPDAKIICNWLMGDISRYLNQNNIEIKNTKLSPITLSKMLKRIEEGVISGKIAKDLISEMLENGTDIDEIIKQRGLVQISDLAVLEEIIVKILDECKGQVDDYLNGKEKVLGFLIGKAMAVTKGKANPQIVEKVLKEHLNKKKEQRDKF